MAKQKITEAQMIKLVENATRRALNNILAEDSPALRTAAAQFKGAYNGVYDKIGDDDFRAKSKNYISNGTDANWEDFDAERGDYDRISKQHNRAKDKLSAMKKNSDSYPSSTMDAAQSDVDYLERERNDAARRTVSTRPGIAGKVGRTVATAGAGAGRLARKAKNKLVNFKHNTLGFEE